MKECGCKIDFQTFNKTKRECGKLEIKWNNNHTFTIATQIFVVIDSSKGNVL